MVAIGLMFGLAAYSLYLNRTASAGVAAAFMLALILVQQLPILESFEVLTLKAKFRAQIDEAAVLLGHLKESAQVSARSTCLQLAYMNRMGDLGWDRKRKILGDIDGQLRRLGVPEPEIAETKRPFINMLTFDLGKVLEHSVQLRLRQYGNELDKLYQQRFSEGIRDHEGHNKFLQWKRGFSLPSSVLYDPLGRADFDNLRGLLEPWFEALPVSKADQDSMRPVLDEVVAIAEACWAAGTVTAEAEAYLDQYAPHADGPDRIDAIAFQPIQLQPPAASAG